MAYATWGDNRTRATEAEAAQKAEVDSATAAANGGRIKDPGTSGTYWIGQDGNVWWASPTGVKNMGKPINVSANGFDAQYGSAQATQQDDPNPGNPGANTSTTNNVGGGGGGAAAKVLDTAGLASLDALIARLGIDKDQAIAAYGKTRDTSKAEKDAEKKREKGKYEGSKLETLQDFSGALTDTDLGTRDTLENLMSSLSTLGLGGSRALTRQLLNAANKSRREANTTQSKDNMNLDSAFNTYEAGYNDDVTKIDDQYNYNVGEANKTYYTGQQDALYKKGGIYADVDDTASRNAVMGQGDALNSLITGSTFLNPKYTGVDKTMATPELGDYSQNIAKYDTTGITGANSNPLIPVASDGMNKPGNLSVRAIAVNDKDLGIKKKSENDLGYGV